MDAIAGDLANLGLEEASVGRLVEVMKLRDMGGVEEFLGKESPAAAEVTVASSTTYQWRTDLVSPHLLLRTRNVSAAFVMG